ncbi:MAG: UDP-N-acetylmuramoyl-L-alanyl-D-glutamate--2, 6-diaminopimelate ligase [Candidatus Celerinatantimonas neptuna]|nr:MAG: UDP-N-acetylmuramoyl-L-alanyl-D-glutamate--2, 6-diaminopimelate ligase [Candidatus Celerinatantimonas neptuna]
MKVRLEQLLSGWFESQSDMDLQIEINNLFIDSRAVLPGSLFVAIKGHQSDGRRYIEQAIINGAVAVLKESDSKESDGTFEYRQGVLIIDCFQLSYHLAELAHGAYPDLPNTIIGVTGTNGKSTVTHLIASLAIQKRIPSAVMGTLGNGQPGQLHGALNTTADILTIYRQLSEFAEQGIELVAMEVSSHGLDQKRVAGIPFKAAVFTNLTRDHLDYHGTMEAYAQAKAKLFNMTKDGVLIANFDDPFGVELQYRYPKTVGYALDHKACWQAHSLLMNEQGCDVQISSPLVNHFVRIPLLGRFNISNVLAALACLVELKLLSEGDFALCQNLQSVPGRMELFTDDRYCQVVVDYAHTPDALAKALQGIREHCSGRLFCIFGCGGDRDKGKRPLMAQAAQDYADRVIVTNDNPRTEDPQSIVADIFKGFENPSEVTVVLERKEALIQVLRQANRNDMVLLAGKGHEDYQIIGHEKRHYDERSVVTQVLTEGVC